MDWIYEHQEDADFNEQLFVVGQEGRGEIQHKYQGGLSKQERIRIAEEKIKARRLERAEEEKAAAHEQELSRLKGGKAQAAARRLWEEQETQIALAQRKKDKEEHELAKMKALLSSL